MEETKENNTLERSARRITFTNIIYAFSAQGISLLLSLIMVLLIPKIVGITEFGYWQLLLLYSGYSGFLHLGLNDGIYLKEGGKKYTQLDKDLLGSQLRFSLMVHTFISIIVIYYSLVFMEVDERKIVWVTIAVCLPLINSSSFIGYIFQAVNETKKFSISIIIEKVFFMIGILFLMLFDASSLFSISLLYIASKMAIFLYCIWIGKELFFRTTLKFKKYYHELLNNISFGIKLLISNISGLLILGNSRIFIERIWGITTFSTVSYSILLANFFLMFIGQISMVLFPVLRRVGNKEMKEFYHIIRDSLSIFLSGTLMLYFPLISILGLWIPQYQESLLYLGLLLPLIIFDGKMNLLCNTYFKVLRKEKFLMNVNLFSLIISLILTLTGAYLLKNIDFIIGSMLFSIVLRSTISEIYLAKLIGKKVYKDIIIDLALVIIFLIPTWYINPITGFIIYLFSYTVFLIYSRNKIKNIIKYFKPLINKK